MVDQNALDIAWQPEERLTPQPQYADYAELITTGVQHIDTSIFTDLEATDNHFHQILNIMSDGVETQQVQDSIVYVHFTDGEVVKLSIFDYWYNVLFWGLPAQAKHPIDSRYLWFCENITQDYIADYINDYFLAIDRHTHTNMEVNNMLDNVMWKFQYVDNFSMFLYNTSNNEDTIELMRKDKEFYDCIHCDLSQVPVEDIKDVGMDYTLKGIERIIASGTHWAAPYFKSGQGLNTKQWREFMHNIGTVPNGEGGVFSRPINSNYCNRGITNPVDYLIEAFKSREAQIITHENVSDSGDFARVLGLNNMDDKLHPDPKYICDSKNFTAVEIKNKKILDMYKNRYYRFRPDGIEYLISYNPIKYNSDLIGKTILVRGPMTCASRSRGMGICHRCYGELAKTNYDINIGKIAAEILSQEVTQKSLSAKHLLESNVKKLLWTECFDMFFKVYFNSIRLKDKIDRDGEFYLNIERDSIMSDYDEDDDTIDSMFSKYVTNVTISGNGFDFPIGTLDYDNMYLSIELEDLINRYSVDDENIVSIPLDELKDINLFFIEVSNTELGKILDSIQSVLNKKSEIKKLQTKEAVLDQLIVSIIDSGLHTDAIHLETILAHQCVSAKSNILDPEWQYPNEEYKMVTLSERLKDNPSVTISLMYKDINKLLFYPLTFMKTKPSVIDLFFMRQPQKYMTMEPEEEPETTEPQEMIKPFTVGDEYH